MKVLLAVTVITVPRNSPRPEFCHSVSVHRGKRLPETIHPALPSRDRPPILPSSLPFHLPGTLAIDLSVF